MYPFSLKISNLHNYSTQKFKKETVLNIFLDSVHIDSILSFQMVSYINSHYSSADDIQLSLTKDIGDHFKQSSLQKSSQAVNNSSSL